MLSVNEFDSATLILKKRFGEAKYPPALTELLYAKFKNVNMKDLQKVCNMLAASAKFAPYYPEINVHLAEKLREYRELRRDRKRTQAGSLCSFCDNTGFIHFLEEWGCAEVAGRCWCEFGEEAEGLPPMNRERAVKGISFDRKLRAEKAKEADEINTREKLERQKTYLKIVEK